MTVITIVSILGLLIWSCIATGVICLTLLLIRRKRLNKFKAELSRIWEERYALADAQKRPTSQRRTEIENLR